MLALLALLLLIHQPYRRLRRWLLKAAATISVGLDTLSQDRPFILGEGLIAELHGLDRGARSRRLVVLRKGCGGLELGQEFFLLRHTYGVVLISRFVSRLDEGTLRATIILIITLFRHQFLLARLSIHLIVRMATGAVHCLFNCLEWFVVVPLSERCLLLLLLDLAVNNIIHGF